MSVHPIETCWAVLEIMYVLEGGVCSPQGPSQVDLTTFPTCSPSQSLLLRLLVNWLGWAGLVAGWSGWEGSGLRERWTGKCFAASPACSSKQLAS